MQKSQNKKDVSAIFPIISPTLFKATFKEGYMELFLMPMTPLVFMIPIMAFNFS